MTDEGRAPAECGSQRESGRLPSPEGYLAVGGITVALLLFVLARGALLAALFPPFHGCDEPGHFNYVQHLAEARTLPVQKNSHCPGASPEVNHAMAGFLLGIWFHPETGIPDPSGYRDLDPTDDTARQTTGCGAHAFYPPLYYVTSALAYATAGRAPLLVRLYRSRLASVFWGMTAALAGLVIGLRLFGARGDAVLLASLVVLQPMFAFLTSVVNSDAAVLGCATCCTAAVACLWRRRSTAALVGLAVSACLGAMTKLTFCFAAPLFFALAVIALDASRLRSWLVAGAAFLPFGAATLGWQLFSHAGSADRLSGPGSSIRFMDFLRDSVFHGERLWDVWVRGYWMNWGWADTKLPEVDYVIICGFGAAAILGLLLGRHDVPPRQRQAVVAVVAYTIALIAALYLVEYVVMVKTGEPGFVSGRYVLALYPVHACVIVYGLRQLSQHLGVRVDAAWAFAALLAVVNMAAILATLHRYFHA